MKRLLIAALLPVLFFACAKEEKTNVQFRTPTCQDTTDEGIFEEYTSSESGELLKYYDTIPKIEDNNAILYTKMTSRVLYNNAVIYDPVFTYKQKKETQLFVYLPYELEKYYSWTQTSADTTDSLNVAIYNLRPLHLTPGCYRLYYIFSEPGYGMVYTKGHYDIEIK